MIILRSISHVKNIRPCMGMCTTALRNKKNTFKFSINTSPYFHSVLIVLWLLTLLQRGHFGELAVTKKAIHEMHFESKARHLMRVWLYFFIPKNGRKYSHTNSYIFAISPVKIPKDVRWLFQDCLFVGDVVTLKLSILPRKQEVKIIMVINQIFLYLAYFYFVKQAKNLLPLP